MKVFFLVVGFVVLAIAAAIAYFCIIDFKAHPPVRCFLTTDGAPLYYGPGPGNQPAGESKCGRVVAVGRVGCWWKLRNGKYVQDIYLLPENWGELPAEL